jgi:molybdopterin converting factor subunit 1
MTGAAGVTVLLFAAAREAAGRGRLEVPHREGLTAAEVWEALQSASPSLAPLAGSISVAVNQRFVPRDTVLVPGDELAFLPPVSGG